ncbi:MAG: hypothetical protein WD767_06980 [Alphaproteobacteria bacterium]
MEQAVCVPGSAIREGVVICPLIRIALAAFVLLFTDIGVGSADSQEQLETTAVISALGIRPIASGARVRIRLADDSDFNRQLAIVAGESLRDAGYGNDSTAPQITLRIETRNNAPGVTEDNSIGRLHADSGGDIDLNVRLWSSNRNSLLKKNTGEAGGDPTYVIQMEAYDEVAGTVAWQAEARTDKVNANNIEAGSAMVRQLIAVFGKASEPVFIPLP